jgi:hypothetical protein
MVARRRKRLRERAIDEALPPDRIDLHVALASSAAGRHLPSATSTGSCSVELTESGS